MGIKMNKRLKFIENINKAFLLITDGTMELDQLMKFCEDENLKDMINKYIHCYATLNYNFSNELIMKLSEELRNQKEEDNFNNLMKDFE